MMNSEMAGSGWVGHWSPGIGDPTVMGWLTVALYAVGVWQCYRVVATHNGRIPRSELMIWWLMVFGLLALGINKQLDLQSALTELGRIIATSQGWYARRHEVQVQFVYAVIAAGGCAAIILVILARKAHAGAVVALVGGAFLMTFIVVRAASFHHVDTFIGSAYLGLKMNWILEMGGIAVILAGASWRLRSVQMSV